MAQFLTAHAHASPRLRAEFYAVEAVGDRVYRIAVAVRNDGYLPTHVTRQAVKMEQAPPVEARIELGEGDELLAGDAVEEIGHLGGFGGRRKVEWLVRFAGEVGGIVEIISKKAGVVRLDLAEVL